MRKLVIIALVIILVSICAVFIFRPSPKLRSELLLADSLMKAAPDSALHVLQNIDSKLLSGENEALYALLMTQAKFKNYQLETSDSLIDIALDYYEDGKDSLRKAEVYYLKGRVDETMNDPKEALIYYQKASEAAQSTNDYNFLSLLYNRWGVLLQQQFLYDDALTMQEKALEYAKLDNDTTKQIFILKNIGEVYSLYSRYEKAFDCYNLALNLAKKIGNKRRICDIYNSLGLLFKLEGKYDSAMIYLDKSIMSMDDANSSLLLSVFSLKGELYLLQEQYDPARVFLDKGKRDNDLYSKAAYCLLMSKLEEKTGNLQAAIDYNQNYIAYSDTLQKNSKQDIVAKLQKRYDYSSFKNKNARLELEAKNRNIIFLSIIIILVIITWIYTHKYAKARRKDKAVIVESKEQLKEVTDKLMEQKESMEEFRQKTMVNLTELREWILSKNNVIKKIYQIIDMDVNQRIAKKEEMVLTEKEVDKLCEVVNACYNNFVVRLKKSFPDLTENNIRLCCLLKMKVPPYAIAALLGVTDDSFIKRKSRIKKTQIKLPEGYSTLEDFLSDF